MSVPRNEGWTSTPAATRCRSRMGKVVADRRIVARGEAPERAERQPRREDVRVCVDEDHRRRRGLPGAGKSF